MRPNGPNHCDQHTQLHTFCTLKSSLAELEWGYDWSVAYKHRKKLVCSAASLGCEHGTARIVSKLLLHCCNGTDRSFLPVGAYASPRLWNQLPASLRQPHTNLSNSDSPSPLSGISSIDRRFHRLVAVVRPHHSPLSSSSTTHSFIDSPLLSSTTPHSFIPDLPSFSANASHHSLPFLLLQDGFPGLLSLSVFNLNIFLSPHFLVVGSMR